MTATGQFGFFHEAPRRALLDCLLVVLQRGEEGLPLGIDRGGVFLVAGVEILDIGRVRPIEESGVEEGLVGVLACHGNVSIQMNWIGRPGEAGTAD